MCLHPQIFLEFYSKRLKLPCSNSGDFCLLLDLARERDLPLDLADDLAGEDLAGEGLAGEHLATGVVTPAFPLNDCCTRAVVVWC